ncbi:hypothetical protein [Phytohabitans houttuyneae]|uniref:hypothetical protein n=1 Tax=Phytohabitans houttuyneae TaxID=1076126 RepID=UPI001567607B|nr:hypothetical protein [Phytohabitans houttuyneae]
MPAPFVFRVGGQAQAKASVDLRFVVRVGLSECRDLVAELVQDGHALVLAESVDVGRAVGCSVLRTSAVLG